MVGTTIPQAPLQPAPGPRRLPGNPGIWVFVLGDMLAFLMYFVVFMIYRHEHPAMFLRSERTLSLPAGLANTLVLLASSRLVARATVAVSAGEVTRARRLLIVAGGCGVAFLAIKTGEWAHLVLGRHTLASDDFFMFYFTLTGVHLFHVLMGLVVLGVCLAELRRPTSPKASVVEAGAVYWHMVDLLWLVLFALLYLMR